MTPLRLAYSAEAADDLEAIYRHIAPDSPAAADRFVRGIEARCEALCETPQLGIERPDLREGVRVSSACSTAAGITRRSWAATDGAPAAPPYGKRKFASGGLVGSG